MIFHDTYYQNRFILVLNLFNSRTLMTQKSSVVISQALETFPASLNSVASATSLASTASKAQFSQKNFLVLMVLSSNKMTNTGPFWGIGSSKIKILTDIWQSLEVNFSWPPWTSKYIISRRNTLYSVNSNS